VSICSAPEAVCSYSQPRGCNIWRQSDSQTIAAGSTSTGWVSISPNNDSVLRRISANVTTALTAPGYATLSLKDQNGDVVFESVDAKQFGSGGLMVRLPHIHLGLSAGVKFKYKIDLSAAEAVNPVVVGTTFGGDQADGCHQAPDCLSSAPCKTFAQSFLFSSAAGALPVDGNIAPDAPMAVDSVSIVSSVDIDSSSVLMAQVSQNGRPFAPPTDVNMLLPLIMLPKFPVRFVDSNNPLQIAWSGDAQASANSMVVTLTGRRACASDCPQ